MSKMFMPIMAAWIFLAMDDVTFQKNATPTCCDQGSDEVNGEISKCFEQKRGPACDKHFFILELNDGKRFCINPDSEWLKGKKENENLTCHPTDGRHHVTAKPKALTSPFN